MLVVCRSQVLREAQAREAMERLEVYKKAGAYAVFKRIEGWQARTGKRLTDGFHAAGGERGNESPREWANEGLG